MAARNSRRSRRSMSDMNVVPYIDVMLVLLVIFMVTAPMMQTGVELDLPNADATPLVNDSGSSALIISVNDVGRFFVADTAVNDVEELARELGDELAADNTRPVYIRADEQVAYRYLMQAMATAQRAGATNIGLMADPAALGN